MRKFNFLFLQKEMNTDKDCFSHEIVELTRLMPSYKSETVFFYDWEWLIMFRVQFKQVYEICIANNL